MIKVKKIQGKVAILCGMIIISIPILNCATNQTAHDLVSYINQGILNITPLELQAINYYTSVTGDNFQSVEDVRHALKNEVIPTYERFTFLLKRIRPENKEIRNLHALYIRGADLICEGFKDKMVAIEKGDNTRILSANNKIEMGSRETGKWRERLFELFEQYHIAQE